ncbi:SDR family oxidoreductase [uncultured Roseibium sp.]|uniref:SDR family oxidoreductase n=1 Tax=uncultured Roseibium sp. TaxID=1936171 RepID=UPI00261D3B1E|nr:SDR family oxidoreductase [uncultured Roseibium sp.]
MLHEKTILITGASSGIGAAAAGLFAASGANLVLTARRKQKLEEVRTSIPDAAGKVEILAGDVSDPDFASAAVSMAVEKFGGLDGAFNNAGMLGDVGPVPEMSLTSWQQVMDTNLTSAFLLAKHQIPALKTRGGGAIVFTSSFVGHTIGLPGMAAYAASKAGLVGLTQVLGVEHGPDNIRVNALLPGGTRTEMAGDDPAFHDYVAGLHALKRMAKPEEIANAAMFLLSDAGSFVTGSAMLCDGGNSITKA